MESSCDTPSASLELESYGNEQQIICNSPFKLIPVGFPVDKQCTIYFVVAVLVVMQKHV